ncbi:MAG: hypothetical protein E7082_08150 [Bacteroidales bacterium]|nr:hypothetical protein [Bacteroidales bacterium]
MTPICYVQYVPFAATLEFDSLKSLLDHVAKVSPGIDYHISETVYQNVEYRNYLRTHGLKALIAHMIEEAPELASDARALQWLEYEFARKGIADYDLRLVRIHDEVTLLGHTFKGIDDIMRHCEAEVSVFSGWKFKSKEAEPLTDVHIVNVYESYSHFISEKEGYDFDYQNMFLFGTEPFANEGDYAKYMKGKKVSLFSDDVMLERVDPNLLPAVYYNSLHDYMFVLTKAGDAPAVTAPESEPKPLIPELPPQKEPTEKFGVGWKIYLAVIFLMPVYSGIVYAVKSSAVSLIAFLMSIAAIVLMPKLRMSTFFLMNALLLASLILTTLRLFGVF